MVKLFEIIYTYKEGNVLMVWVFHWEITSLAFD